MDSVPRRAADDPSLASFIAELSPEARRDLRAVYKILIEHGLRSLAEHSATATDDVEAER